MSADEMKSIPKGHFAVMKTGCHPMRTQLRLFLDWGITFEEPYTVPERTDRRVSYAGRRELVESIMKRYYSKEDTTPSKQPKKPRHSGPRT